MYRAVIDYQLFGEGPLGKPLDPQEWLDSVMKDALDKRTIGAYSLENSFDGSFGLKYLLFTVDMDFLPHITESSLRAFVHKTVAELIGEPDFSIRFIIVA